MHQQLQQEATDIALPSYSIPKIFSMRESLENHLELLDFPGAVLNGPLAERLLIRLLAILPSTVQSDALWGTLEPYIGRELTPARWKKLIWRICGNLTNLKNGRPVLPYRMQSAVEWVPLQVVGAKRVPAKYGKSAAKFQFRALAGTPSGILLEQRWTLSFCRLISRRLGFSRRTEDRYPYRHYTEMVSLRLYGLFEPDLCVKSPNFKEIRVPGTFEKWNRRILGMRERIDFNCPEGFQHPCHQCHIGFEQCPAATHRYTYVFRRCERCADDDAPFQPLEGHKICVNCQARRDIGLD